MLTAGDLAIQIPLTAGEDEWQGANKGGSSVCALGIAQSSEKELVYLFTCLLVYLFTCLFIYILTRDMAAWDRFIATADYYCLSFRIGLLLVAAV